MGKRTHYYIKLDAGPRRKELKKKGDSGMSDKLQFVVVAPQARCGIGGFSSKDHDQLKEAPIKCFRRVASPEFSPAFQRREG
jgi:hypothetical protein